MEPPIFSIYISCSIIEIKFTLRVKQRSQQYHHLIKDQLQCSLRKLYHSLMHRISSWEFVERDSGVEWAETFSCSNELKRENETRVWGFALSLISGGFLKID